MTSDELWHYAKIDRVANHIPAIEPHGDNGGDLLVLGWGGTYGAIVTAVDNARKAGKSVSAAHLRYLNPFPKNLGELMGRFKKVLIPELNMGQLRLLIRAKYLVDAKGYNKVQGKPFLVEELEEAINLMLDNKWGDKVSIQPKVHSASGQTEEAGG